LSTSSIALIKKIQLKILSQLYAIRSQDLSFLRKNDPLYGSPQNRQLRKTTAASPIKSSATWSTADRAPPVESSAPGALDSTDDVLVLFQWNRHSLNYRRSQSSPVDTLRAFHCHNYGRSEFNCQRSWTSTKSTIFTTTPWLHVEEQID